MWQPDPEWTPITGGRGTLTVGVWRGRHEGAGCVVKRVRTPGADDPVQLAALTHPGYWRRELEVALAGPQWQGLVPTRTLRVEEDEEGYTIWTALVEPDPVTGLFAAAALGRFAASPLPDVAWLSHTLLRTRLQIAEERGGWPTLARTTAAPLVDALWSRRHALLDRYDALPQRLCHGDAVPGNLIAPRDGEVVALDWASLGIAPAGADLGYFALSCREHFEVLTATFADHHPAARHDIAFAARVMAVYTVCAQAEWALARVAGGEGGLAATYRHPAVAPYLRALQRQYPQIEALLADAQPSR